LWSLDSYEPYYIVVEYIFLLKFQHGRQMKGK